MDEPTHDQARQLRKGHWKLGQGNHREQDVTRIKLTGNEPALLAGALNIGLAFLFVPKLGVLGVALAVATAQMLTNNWYVPYVSRSYLHFSWQEVARTVWLPLSILAIVQVSFNLGIARSFGSNNGFLFLLVSFLLSSSVGVALTTRIMLSASDRMLIWKELARRFGPRPCAMVISAE